TNIAFGAQVLVGLAVTSHNNTVLNTSVFDNVSLQAVTPQVFTASDIGPTGLAGSTQVNSGTYTLQGAGADIWEVADGFHYYHRSMSGDGSITARVASLTNTHAWAKAGVMIRESSAPEARHVFMGLTPANGAEFLRRNVVNGTTSVSLAAATSPYWVRLARVGDVFTAAVSSDGSTWTQVGTMTLPMGADARVGLAVCSHDTTVRLTGVFDNVTIVE
ncbi:MAG TPA: DUF1349 domain-containing protein, partial [Fibrobacteria bacterium]|nr:DUF1349 domain-containing protein [Fibrobacteria bacterium]